MVIGICADSLRLCGIPYERSESGFGYCFLELGYWLFLRIYKRAIILAVNYNPARRTMWVWVAITLLAFFGIFAPSIFGMDGFNGGFALSFICIIIALTGVFVVLMYRGRAATLDSIIQGKDVLAHWKYSAEEWRRYTEKAYEIEKKEKWGLFLFVMAIAIIVLIGFWLFNRDSGVVVIAVFVGLAAILSVTILLTTSYTHWQNKKYHGEVYIGRDGVFLNRQLHLWRGWGAELEKAGYDEKERLISITYSIPSRQGRDTHSVHVPVPKGRENEVKAILAALAERATGCRPCR